MICPLARWTLALLAGISIATASLSALAIEYKEHQGKRTRLRPAGLLTKHEDKVVFEGHVTKYRDCRPRIPGKGKLQRGNPAKIKARVFCKAKGDFAKETSEDAAAVDRTRGIGVVVDGMTRSGYPGIWARILAEGFVQSPPVEDSPFFDVQQWLEPLQQKWNREIDGAQSTQADPDAWLDVGKAVRQGAAGATMIGVEVVEQEGKLQWHATWPQTERTTADSGMVRISGPGRFERRHPWLFNVIGRPLYKLLRKPTRRRVEHAPALTAKEFTSEPAILSADPDRNGNVVFQRQRGDLGRREMLLLLSDALFQQLMRYDDLKRNEILEELIRVETQGDFDQIIERERREGRQGRKAMTDDDSTMVRIEIDRGDGKRQGPRPRHNGWLPTTF